MDWTIALCRAAWQPHLQRLQSALAVLGWPSSVGHHLAAPPIGLLACVLSIMAVWLLQLPLLSCKHIDFYDMAASADAAIVLLAAAWDNRLLLLATFE